jgi:hypothetical protein
LMFFPSRASLKTRERTARFGRKPGEKTPSIVDLARPRYCGLLRSASRKHGEKTHNSKKGYTTAAAAETKQGVLRIDAGYQKSSLSALLD